MRAAMRFLRSLTTHARRIARAAIKTIDHNKVSRGLKKRVIGIVLAESEPITIDHFTSSSRHQGIEYDQIDGLLDESYRTVGEQGVEPAGME